MIADIHQDVQTDFAVYRPVPVDVTPAVSPFAVEPDFSNIPNFDSQRWNFTETDLALLAANHFVAKHSRFEQIYDTYNECTWDGTPIFVTTDAVLHIYHVLFDQILMDAEVRVFTENLDNLLQALIDETTFVYYPTSHPDLAEAARRNLAYLLVARKLLIGDTVEVPAEVADLVQAELDLIESHEGFADSPIFGNFSALDYSQFQPRGHYTKTDELKAYFKSMMWLGWTIFTMEPDLFGNLASRHTLQALLLTQMIYKLDGGDLFDEWSGIYDPTVFFVGKTDDPCIKQYKPIAEQVYGSDFLDLAPIALTDPTLLDEFMTQAQTLPEPRIPNWVYGSTSTTYKGFRLMGQRFIPDSYMFAHLVLPEVPGRNFPKGLDVMAILGSGRAYEILDTFYEETKFTSYSPKIAEFQAEFIAKSDADWAQNLYWNWLYTLMPLLFAKGDGYPSFMQSSAWTDKELMAALASWAELRHDTILYAKQSMSPCGIAPGPPRSYVEPNPHLYARLASLVRYTREGLDTFDLLSQDFIDRLDLFENLLLFLLEISIKELEDTPLTDAQYEDIFCFGKVMQDLVTFPIDPNNPYECEADDMAVIADVHTDSNTDMCLEEGVGYPLEIFVIVNEGGAARLTRGAVFSYYEFTQPIADRLTDEAWREMLNSDNPPEMPGWISFIDRNVIRPERWEGSIENLFEKEFSAVVPNLKLPISCALLQNYPNPFNPETTIEFTLNIAGRVVIEIYDLLGRRIQTLIDAIRPAGWHTVRWDGKDETGNCMPSGLYMYTLKANSHQLSKKMFLLR